MQKAFKAQKIVSMIYVVMAIITFLYSLIFMTEYKDLFGFKLKLNEEVAHFHDVILQNFNKQIFALALFAIVVIVFMFFLQIFSCVPDKFAVIILEICLIACCAGAVYAMMKIPVIESTYRNLDTQNLYMEGMKDFQHKFTTFRVGMVVYLLQLIVSIFCGVTMIVSHVAFKKFEKKGRMENE